MIYLDITRLLNRLKATSPTGIDRVEFEYAQQALASGWGFVAQDNDHVAQMPTWSAELVVGRLRERWGNGAPEDHLLSSSVQEWRKTIRPRRKASDTENFFRSVRSKALAKRWSAVYQAKEQIAARAPYLPTAVSMAAIAAFPGLFAAIFKSNEVMDQPTFRVNPTFENNIYLNVGHSGLEKTRLLKALRSRPNLRTVVYIHDLLPMTHPHLFPEKDVHAHALRMRNVKEFADQILVNSNYTREQFEERFGIGSVRGVFEIGSLAQQPKGFRNGPRSGFVSIGTIEPRKNYLWLVEAWLDFVRKNPGLINDDRLTIFGKVGWLPEEDRRKLLAVVEGSDHVDLITGASDDEVRDRLSNARAYLSAAEVEGWGMPLAESLVHGTPVIGTDISAHREVTRGHAEFFEYGNEQAFQASLQSCFDPATYQRMLFDASKFQPWGWQSHFDGVNAVLRSLA